MSNITCPDNCGTDAPLVWAKNHKGSKMIFELEPHPKGKWILEKVGRDYEVRLAGESYEGDLFICHWDICRNRPADKDHGRRGAAPAAAPPRRGTPAPEPRAAVQALSTGSAGIEASVIVNGVTYYGVLKPVADAAPQNDSDLADL